MKIHCSKFTRNRPCVPPPLSESSLNYAIETGDFLSVSLGKYRTGQSRQYIVTAIIETLGY